MKPNARLVTLLSSVLLLLPACAARPAASAPAPAASPAALPRALSLSLDDFGALRWLEGTWRGVGVGESAFFERYRFLNDSTIAIESFTDSTLVGTPETGEVRWRDGLVTTGSGGALWVVTRRDGDAWRFEPVAGARNTFTWRRDSDDAWTAVLSWPATGDVPARDRVYHLRRWP